MGYSFILLIDLETNFQRGGFYFLTLYLKIKIMAACAHDKDHTTHTKTNP